MRALDGLRWLSTGFVVQAALATGNDLSRLTERLQNYDSAQATNLSRVPLIEIKREALRSSRRNVSTESSSGLLEEHLFGKHSGGNEDLFVAQFLWSHGLSIDAKLPSGTSALERAIRSRNIWLIQQLMDWGARAPCNTQDCAELLPKHPSFLEIRNKLQSLVGSSDGAAVQKSKSDTFRRSLANEIEFFDAQRRINERVGFKVLDYDQQKKLELSGPTLFVTHVSGSFKGSELIYKEVDQVTEHLKKQGVKAVYLMIDPVTGQGLDLNWQTQDKNPHATLYSTAGEHYTRVRSHDLHFVGGYQAACFGNTISFALNSFFEEHPKPTQQTLRLTLYPKAVFSTTSMAMCRWVDKKTFAVRDPSDTLTSQLYQDLLNRNPDLGERATVQFFRNGQKIGTRGEGPQKIEVHLSYDLAPSIPEAPADSNGDHSR
jgi:hypothetical protein